MLMDSDVVEDPSSGGRFSCFFLGEGDGPAEGTSASRLQSETIPSSRQSFLFHNALLSAARCHKWAASNRIIGADVGTFQKHLLSHEKEN